MNGSLRVKPCVIQLKTMRKTIICLTLTDFKQRTSNRTNTDIAKKAYNSPGKYKSENSKHMKMVDILASDGKYTSSIGKMSQSLAESSNGSTVRFNGYHSQYV